jgi:hypothetical protein
MAERHELVVRGLHDGRAPGEVILGVERQCPEFVSAARAGEAVDGSGIGVLYSMCLLCAARLSTYPPQSPKEKTDAPVRSRTEGPLGTLETSSR